MKYYTDNRGYIYDEEEYIKYLEGLALGIWYSQNWNRNKYLNDHCKSYDPLMIEKKEDKFIAHSYVFNFKDGGRHHKFDNLDELYNELINEIKNE